MKKKTILPLLIVFTATLALASCGDEKGTSTTAETVTTDDGYPLKVCVVSGEELGSMGAPVVVTHEGTTVKLCCEHCLPKFNAEPAKYIAKLKK